MRDNIAEGFRKQAGWCAAMGSPFMARLCDLLRTRLIDASRFGARIWSWPGDPVADALALRAAGGLHALARSGAVPPLTDTYPPYESDDESLWAAVASAIAAHDEMLHDYLDSPPQTNEVARSGLLLGLALLVAEHTGLPLRLFEIGSSAGLNLNFDRYTYDLGQGAWGYANVPVNIACEWRGKMPDLQAPLRVIGRFGCDQHPLDASDPTHRNRLVSYIWADQRERLERLEAALDFAAAAGTKIARSDAADFVARHFAPGAEAGSVRVLMHTSVWQYLPPATQSTIEAVMQEAGAHATKQAPLAWISKEPAGSDDTDDGLFLTLWPGGEKRRVGTANAHGRWAEWAL